MLTLVDDGVDRLSSQRRSQTGRMREDNAEHLCIVTCMMEKRPECGIANDESMKK